MCNAVHSGKPPCNSSISHQHSPVLMPGCRATVAAMRTQTNTAAITIILLQECSYRIQHTRFSHSNSCAMQDRPWYQPASTTCKLSYAIQHASLWVQQCCGLLLSCMCEATQREYASQVYVAWHCQQVNLCIPVWYDAKRLI